MIKEAIGVGETLEEATEKAKAELNVSFEDEVQFEVLANPKKKTLGLFGGSPAKVRVFVELPDPAPKKREKPARKKDNKPAKKAEVAPKKAIETPAADAIPADKIDANTPAGRAVAYLKTILANLGLEGTEISVIPSDNGARIILTGENLGIVIGRRGETLDALQYLVSLAANTGDGFFRVSLDTGNYREKREQTLKGLAHRMSKQVLRTGRSRTLEPMNPYERRIIHTEVQSIEGVESHSVGEGSGRRVVISQVGGNRRDDRRGGRRNDSHKVTAPVADRAPKSDAADLPLYGKID
ncbi:MAG: protein jag [Clostridia bacterium]|nr:protein jag [Clostridia bacterium]MEE1277940.1 RNA-binding cell elongation regulator Jag/EloR [Acutalibacteraceae bacterium]